MESMQASLEGEQRSKGEALRIKKKREGDINELEIALDHSNKANSEAQKSIKRYQAGIHKVLCSHGTCCRMRMAFFITTYCKIYCFIFLF
jgi:hypothetical protein